MVVDGGHFVPGDELYRGPGSATVLCVDVVHQGIQGLPAARIAVLTEYIFYCMRAILFLSSSKILTPHRPLPLASLSSPATKAGGTHSPGGEGDGGGQYFGRREK